MERSSQLRSFPVFQQQSTRRVQQKTWCTCLHHSLVSKVKKLRTCKVDISRNFSSSAASLHFILSDCFARHHSIYSTEVKKRAIIRTLNCRGDWISRIEYPKSQRQCQYWDFYQACGYGEEGIVQSFLIFFFFFFFLKENRWFFPVQKKIYATDFYLHHVVNNEAKQS